MQEACERASTIEVVAVYDPDQAEMDLAAERFGCYKAVSYEELIRREDVEAVLLITPNHLHRKQVVAALEAGLHVFVEKPIATTLDEGLEMISKAEAKGRVLAIGHNMRYWQTARKAKDMLAAGKLGQVISTEIHFSAPTGMQLPVDSWRRKADLCPLLPVTQLAVHAFDLVHFLLGYIEEVSTYARSALTNDEVIDSVSSIFKVNGGILGTMVSNYCTPELFQLRIAGTRGALRITPDTFWFREIDPVSGKSVQVIEEIDEDKGFQSYRQIVEAFGEAVIEHTFPETDGWVGLQALAVVEAMQRSSTSSATPWVVERFKSASLANIGIESAISQEML